MSRPVKFYLRTRLAERWWFFVGLGTCRGVVYYKQDTTPEEKQKVAGWTRELIDALLPRADLTIFLIKSTLHLHNFSGHTRMPTGSLTWRKNWIPLISSGTNSGMRTTSPNTSSYPIDFRSQHSVLSRWHSRYLGRSSPSYHERTFAAVHECFRVISPMRIRIIWSTHVL